MVTILDTNVQVKSDWPAAFQVEDDNDGDYYFNDDLVISLMMVMNYKQNSQEE